MRVILPRETLPPNWFQYAVDRKYLHARGRRGQVLSAIGLFVLAASATLTIFVRDPLLGWGYALGIFLLGGYCAARQILVPTTFRVTVAGVALAVIALWGFAQLATGATVYRYATWNASLAHGGAGRDGLGSGERFSMTLVCACASCAGLHGSDLE